MNDTTPPSQFTELVLRRRVDPFSLFGKELPGNVWIVVLVFVLLAGFFYIGWMYLKDSRGVGAGWAIFLGFLRASVYVLLAWVFLLPGRQSVESSTSHSKVLLLFDTSLSLLHTVDDPPVPGKAFESMPTRQDKVLDLLQNDKVNFFGRLEEKNPITAYRFASATDEDFWYFDTGRNWTRAERIAFEEKMRDPLKAKEPLPEPKALQSEILREWLKPVPRLAAAAKPTVPPEEWSDDDKARFKTLQDATQKLRDKSFFNGTNVSDSVQSVLTKEMNAMVQGIVVFTDGRSTQGSDLVFEELERRAKSANIPIFVVGVGDDRPQVKIEIVDTRGPVQVQPEDRFKIVVEITGEGLPEADIEPTLEIVQVVKDKSGNVKTDKSLKEETLEIMLIEAEDKTNPNKKRREISLGKDPIVLQPDKKAKFDRSSPPRVQVEYPIDAYALAKAKGIDLTAGEYANAKWELGETKESELRARQHVPKDRMEIMAAKEHVGDPLDLRVIKRPVRVLLLASGPTHDFQFLNNLLVREVEKKRAEESIHMQLPPGRTPAERRSGQVYGPPAERLLDHFPNRLDAPSDNAADKYYDLAEYDVIVAFDPDWSQLTEDDMKVLQRWVDKGGGLVVVGGPINTVQLAKPGAKNDKVKPVLELYPVNLKDVRIDELDRTTDQPWALTFEGATPEMEFLKLDDNPDRKFLSDWTEFFYGVSDLAKGEPPPPVQNGFFNYYPSESVKVGSQVVARFTDPRSKMKDGTQMPYIALSDPNSGRRVVWIANGETYRLRKFSEAYHERFWTKLLRYAGANNQAKISKRISLNMSSKYKTNQFIQVDARIDGPGGIPLGRNAKVKIKLTVPTGVDQKEIPTEIEMKPKPGRDPLDEGKFQAKFQVRSPGEYGLELKVQDTGDTDARKFMVVEANPELDDTRPDFDRMYHMASEADAVLARMAPADGAELKKRLQRPKLNVSPGKEAVDDKTRLFFTLQNAELIPNCMVSRTDTRTTRGQIDDIWDKDAQIWLPMLGWITIMPFSYGWLYVAVLLFSIEWLTRKLLRLA